MKTGLMISAECGYIDIAQALIDTDSSVEHIRMSGGDKRQTALIMAAKGGHTDIVRALVIADPSVEHIRFEDYYDFYFESTAALLYAARGGHTDTVRALIAADPSVEHIRTTSTDGFTALMYAAGARQRVGPHDDAKRARMVCALIDADGSAEHLQMESASGKTALDLCVDRQNEQNGEIEALLREAWAAAGITPSVWRQLWGMLDQTKTPDISKVREFLDMGVDVNQTRAEGRREYGVRSRDRAQDDVDGSTLLCAALKHGHNDVALLLITEGAIIDFFAAAALGDIGTIEEMLKDGEVNVDKASDRWGGQTALIIAAERGHADVVALLVREGADVNTEAWDGGALFKAAKKGHAEVVAILIREGKADVNQRAHLTYPLCVAAEGGHTEVVALLIQEGKADVNQAERCNGMTPLFLATYNKSTTGHAHAACATLLVTVGQCDVNISALGYTALELAQMKRREGVHNVGHEEIIALLKTGLGKAARDKARAKAKRLRRVARDIAADEARAEHGYGSEGRARWRAIEAAVLLDESELTTLRGLKTTLRGPRVRGSVVTKKRTNLGGKSSTRKGNTGGKDGNGHKGGKGGKGEGVKGRKGGKGRKSWGGKYHPHE